MGVSHSYCKRMNSLICFFFSSFMKHDSSYYLYIMMLMVINSLEEKKIQKNHLIYIVLRDTTVSEKEQNSVWVLFCVYVCMFH